MLTLFLTLIDDESDKEKFITIYEDYSKLMHYLANQILHDNALSEDAVQEALIRVAKNIKKIPDVKSPQTKYFVVVVVKNVAKSMLQKEKRFYESEPIEDLDKNCSKVFYNDDAFEELAKNDIVESTLKLDEKYKNPLLLNAMGFSAKEISYLLGISIEATKKRIQRARQQILECLKGEDYE